MSTVLEGCASVPRAEGAHEGGGIRSRNQVEVIENLLGRGEGPLPPPMPNRAPTKG